MKNEVQFSQTARRWPGECCAGCPRREGCRPPPSRVFGRQGKPVSGPPRAALGWSGPAPTLRSEFGKNFDFGEINISLSNGLGNRLRQRFDPLPPYGQRLAHCPRALITSASAFTNSTRTSHLYHLRKLLSHVSRYLFRPRRAASRSFAERTSVGPSSRHAFTARLSNPNDCQSLNPFVRCGFAGLLFNR
jgi:hypothetical protein